jgi:hypothetical protein
MWRLNHNVNEQSRKNMAKIIIKNHIQAKDLQGEGERARETITR